MARDYRKGPKPYPAFRLTNNNAMIRQTKKRIEELSQRAEAEYEGWAFDGSRVEMNREANRLQIIFDEKPDVDVRTVLKNEGFRWSPKEGAWQRQLNGNAVRAAKHLECLRPLPERQPETTEPIHEPASGCGFYIIPDLKTWADNAEDRSPIEHFASFEEAKARFLELRPLGYNSEAAESSPDGRPPARLTLGIESGDGLSAADILQVRQG